MERACSRIQSFVLLPLDWELVYVTGLKSEKFKHMYADLEDMYYKIGVPVYIYSVQGSVISSDTSKCTYMF